MTHLGNRQGPAEVLLCPEEAKEGVCLSLPVIMAAASREQKHHRLDFKRTEIRTKQNLTDMSQIQAMAAA